MIFGDDKGDYEKARLAQWPGIFWFGKDGDDDVDID